MLEHPCGIEGNNKICGAAIRGIFQKMSQNVNKTSENFPKQRIQGPYQQPEVQNLGLLMTVIPLVTDFHRIIRER